MRPIRNSAKAVIEREGQLLVIVKRDEHGEYCLLPGGGQEPGESLAEALRRECREELGTDVLVGELLCVRDYIGGNHEFVSLDGDVHQVEFMLACTVPDRHEARSGDVPDSGQVDVRWVPLEELSQARLYPATLARWLVSPEPRPRYLGDVN